MDFFVRDLFAEGNPVTYLIFLKEKLKIGNNLSSPSWPENHFTDDDSTGTIGTEFDVMRSVRT
jgi:hypothetical protein